MFDRLTLQDMLDGLVTVPHVVRLLSPYSFELAPESRAAVVQYRVVGERVAFEMRAVVSTGYLAVGLRSAIVAGALANPERVGRLESDLVEMGWTPDVRLATDTFHLESKRLDIAALSDFELMETCIRACAKLSEFVLDQLVITRAYGEMRPATLRLVAEDTEPSDPWLYDPSERDRSSAVHRALENWLLTRLRSLGVEPMDPAGEPYFDVAWSVHNTLFVCEVKSTINNETKQLRLATGQLLHYIALLERVHEGTIRGVILTPSPPAGDVWQSLLDRLGVTLLWPDRWLELEGELTGETGGTSA